jgi:hypothetical protein
MTGNREGCVSWAPKARRLAGELVAHRPGPISVTDTSTATPEPTDRNRS